MARSILITGCSTGIGRDAALGLRDRGWRVFASCRSETDCAALRAQGLDSPRIDYGDPTSIGTGVAEVLDATGGTLDALYNNGAYAIPGALEDLPREALAAIFDTNLFGVHDLTCQVIPVMRAQGHGRIINCSSVLGLVSSPWKGAYCATKFALEGLTDALRIEMRDTPIDVILLEPGPTATEIRRNSIPHFETWIDWKNAPRRDQYERKLMPRLYQADRAGKPQLPASAVTRVLIRALDARRPKARYRVTWQTGAAAVMRRAMPAWLIDRIMAQG